MNEPTAAPTPVAKQCYAHEHLTPSQYGFLDVCRALSKGNGRGFLYFDGTTVANLFTNFGRSTAYSLAHKLTELGWFKVVKPSVTLPSGRRSATVYLVLDHDQWAAEHPGACAELAFVKQTKLAAFRAKHPATSPVQNQVLEPVQNLDGSPVQNPISPVQKSREPVQNPVSPVQNRVHNSVTIPTYKSNPVPATPPSASPESGVVNEFCERFLPKAERKRESAAKLDSAKTSPDSGQDVSDTLTPEQASVADAINVKLGNTLPLKQEPWETAVRHLVRSGVSPDTIATVFDRHVNERGEQYVHQQQAHGFERAFHLLQQQQTSEAA